MSQLPATPTARTAAAAAAPGRAAHRALALAAALACGFAPAPASAQAVPLPEVLVTTAVVPDFEFDTARNGRFCASCNFGAGNARLTFFDADGNLFVGGVDFQTGAFVPPDGRGLLLDTGVPTSTDFGNGPEWMHGAQGSEILYTKWLDPLNPTPAAAGIARARMLGAGVWSAGFFDSPANRASPAGSLDPEDAAPRLHYVVGEGRQLFWRSMDTPEVERALPIEHLTDGRSRRWVPGTRQIVFQGRLPDVTPPLDQVFRYDTDTGVLEQLTSETKSVVGATMWRAPEFGGDFVFLTMGNSRKAILVFRRVTGGDGVARWTKIKTIKAPSTLPYWWSPEVFVHNGRSWVFGVVSSSQRFTDLRVPTQLAMSGIDPLRNDFRMLTNDAATPRVRLDPEYFITAQGPFVYYNRAIPETATRPAVNDGVWRVDTRLGPPIRPVGTGSD